ncbi:hypothetical protein I79_024125 [Cricetulus griseus]|uniref:Uncharacterized protein n=1 Tax=Cricetulus griseus TaxID=10029 RepID=G3IJT8_CRIGR|nr:hypothetical protein I79_024125 [Cricetulus griseus]
MLSKAMKGQVGAIQGLGLPADSSGYSLSRLGFTTLKPIGAKQYHRKEPGIESRE